MEHLVAALRPQADVPATVRRLPSVTRSSARKAAVVKQPRGSGKKSQRSGADQATDQHPTEGPKPSRHIPAAVRREVWARDESRCACVGTAGRCHERGFLEFHHVVPYANGGEATARNIELRCRQHNRFEAECWFGEDTLPTMLRDRRHD